MFNERYGLNDAVLEGYKKNTRRAEFSAEEQQVLDEADDVYMDADDVVAHFDSGVGDVRFGTRYKVGEVVAVAQSYENIHDSLCIGDPLLPAWAKDSHGWRNKMFVKAELMPHRIRITGVCAERLQGISGEDCIKEGVRVVVPDFAAQPTLYEGAGLLRETPPRSLCGSDRQGFRPRHVGQQSVGRGIRIRVNQIMNI